MNKNAVVTGAGSGVGQAVALLLVKQGWCVAIVGRRAEALQETVERAGVERDRLFVFACDIGKSDAVEALGREVMAKFGTVEAVVNAAGTNAPASSTTEAPAHNVRTTVPVVDGMNVSPSRNEWLVLTPSS